jgi:hypothetical protein
MFVPKGEQRPVPVIPSEGSNKVPEPETWTLMVGGLALLGGFTRDHDDTAASAERGRRTEPTLDDPLDILRKMWISRAA